MRRCLQVAGCVVAVLAIGSIPASAASDITITLDRHTVGQPGAVITLVEHAVDASLQGATCTGRYEGANNSSVHPGTDLLISSNGGQVVLSGVEDTPAQHTVTSATVTLGATITISVRLGPDGDSSLGASVVFDCVPAPTTTPSTLPPTTASVLPTVIGSTTTTTTTTMLAAQPTTSAQVAVLAPTTSPPASLPSTGSSDTGILVVFATALLATGWFIRSRGNA